MKSYLEAALDFMESEEMRDYLQEELPKFRGVAMYCADIVAYAPAPIERKLPVLERIVQEAEPVLARDGEPFTAEAVRYAQSCRNALEERYHNVDGAMFRVYGSCYDECYNEDEPFFDDDELFFTSFDAAIHYMKELAKEYPEDSSCEGVNYTIYKYLPTEQGQLAAYCTWYLNNTLEVWYFDYARYSSHRDSLIDYCGNLNLPVPFQPGDIIMADCLPYAAPRRILILEVGDNLDCCCLQALSINKDGYLSTGAVKHNSFLSLAGDNSMVSGLYRARRWTGELSAEEEPFAVLSPLLYARPEFGSEIWDYFHRLDSSKRHSLVWQELKNGLGL